MSLSKKEILFTSIVGSKLAKSIPRFSLVQNELSKHVIPAIPFLPFKNDKLIYEGSNQDISANINQSNKPIGEDKQFFPIYFRRSIPDEPWYLFPYEPMISITGKNNIVRRNIAKAKNFIGTVKEYYSQDDYEITITGILFGSIETGNVEDCFPKEDFQKLKDYCTHPEGIMVKCEPLQLLGINYLVVEIFDFPFTKGENVQAYELKTYSDFTPDVLLEIEE